MKRGKRDFKKGGVGLAALFRCLVLTTTLGVFPALSAAISSPAGLIHVSLREDGVNGDGTEADPYNGNTPERLLNLLREAPDGSRIIFAPGTYGVGTGLAIVSGKSLSIQGTGRTRTILKLQDNLPSGKSPDEYTGGCVVNFWGSGALFTSDSALHVSDLTLDANVGGSPKAKNFTADAFHTNYPTVVMERVNVVNCGGSENYPKELFHFLAWYPNPDNPLTRTWNWYQRFNDIHVLVRSGQVHTSTVFAVGTTTGQPPIVPATGYAIVENSRFEISSDNDRTYGIGMGTQNGAVFRDNIVIMRGRAIAWNADTWDHAATTIERNKFYLYDESGGIRLGSGPDEGTFYDEIIRDNQFFAASSRIRFAIQLNGISGVSVTGNQFLSWNGARGRLTPIEICNQYVPHKNERVVVRDNLLDSRLFQFPVVTIQGEPREGVVTAWGNNRSLDGAAADGLDNDLMAEREMKADISLDHAAATTQVLEPQARKLTVTLPGISNSFAGPACVVPGRRFVIRNSGKFGLAVVDAAKKPLLTVKPSAVVELLATSEQWIAFAKPLVPAPD